MTEKEQKFLNDSLERALFENKPIEEIKALIEKGADVNAEVDSFGVTVWMVARTVEQTKLFIKAGADVNAKDVSGRTVLMFNPTAEQIKLLIDAGVNVHAKDEHGMTALMYAETAEQTKLLIKAGANVNAKDEDGMTALTYAKTAEQTKLLIDAGANVLAKDKYGCTVLDEYRRDNLYYSGEFSSRVGPDDYRQNSEQKKLLQAMVPEPAKKKAKIRLNIEARKKQILKSRKIRKEIEKREGKVSGVVLADEIAKDVISGKEKRTITPEVGAEIKRRKAFEK